MYLNTCPEILAKYLNSI